MNGLSELIIFLWFVPAGLCLIAPLALGAVWSISAGLARLLARPAADAPEQHLAKGANAAV